MKAYPEDESKITLVRVYWKQQNSKANILLKPNQQVIINQKANGRKYTMLLHLTM